MTLVKVDPARRVEVSEHSPGPTSSRAVTSGSTALMTSARLRAGLDDVTFHGLRHSFVAIMVAARCNVHEVSDWAGHTLRRHRSLDVLLGGFGNEA